MNVPSARSMAIPALEAIAPLALVAIGVVVAGQLIEEADPSHGTLLSWSITLACGLALWSTGLVLRRSDRGMRILLSLVCGIAVAGGLAILLATGESFPQNANTPDTALALLGLQAMVVSLGGLVAAFGLEYRRSDPWYVIAFAAAAAPLAITAGAWVYGLRDAPWL